MLGSLLEVEMSKKCMPLWREAHFEVKMYKAHHAQTTFKSCDVEKVYALWCEAYFEVKPVKNGLAWSTFERSDVGLCGRGKGFCMLSKVSKT